jgi:hypothetical protein
VSFETDNQYFPVCPHCGHVDQNWWDGSKGCCDGDAWVDECRNCEKEYDVLFEVIYYFTTGKIKEEAKPMENQIGLELGAKVVLKAAKGER